MGNKMKIGVLSLFIAGVTLGAYSNADARMRRNEVRSEHIRDGEVRNQDIGANSVTTDKIQDGQVQNADIGNNAVTTDKIAPAAVDNADLGTNSVTTDKIANGAVNNQDIAGGTVNSSDIAGGAVTTPKLADGAVTGAKVADGAIMDADINVAANIDPNKFAPGTFSKLYDQVINVSTDGNGDFTDPVAAMASITDNSVNTTYLLKIMPGVYNTGAIPVQMKPYVDIEGCGENVTRITGNVNGASSGVVRGADNAELRLLTVENIGGSSSFTIAIYNSNASPKLTRVTAIGSGSGTTNIRTVYNSSSSNPTMTNVAATASGGEYTFSVFNNNSNPIMNNVTASSSGASSTNRGIYNTASDPNMNNVAASASGGSTSYGIVNWNSSPSTTNVTASASGGSSSNYGVYSYSSSGLITPVMTNVIATGSGGGFAYGIYNENSSASMTNVTASGSGGSTANYGVRNLSSGTVTIDRSVISGASWTVWNDGAVTNVAHTRLDGGIAANTSGTLTCAGVYDENYTFFTGPGCP